MKGEVVDRRAADLTYVVKGILLDLREAPIPKAGNGGAGEGQSVADDATLIDPNERELIPGIEREVEPTQILIAGGARRLIEYEPIKTVIRKRNARQEPL